MNLVGKLVENLPRWRPSPGARRPGLRGREHAPRVAPDLTSKAWAFYLRANGQH